MIRASLLAFALAPCAVAAAPAPDPHAGHVMPSADPHAGHTMPSAAAPADPHAGHVMPSADPHAGHAMPAEPAAPADPHAGHVMPAQPAAPADPHAGHAMGSAAADHSVAARPVGGAPAPPVISDNLADGVFGAGPMQRARDILREEHGGARASKLQAELLEWAPDGDSYGWEIEGWYGGDLNRVVVKTEGEGEAREGLEAAEVQVLYSRAVTRYTDVQIGVRYDLEPRSRAYAALSAEAVLPYWFEVEGSLFVSQKGDLLARVEGSYDLRLTQRLILQPRAEIELAAQDIADSEIGSGLSRGELGLRLRYEFRRELAPYIGVSYERSFGATARFAAAHGEDVDSTRVVLGIRAWF